MNALSREVQQALSADPSAGDCSDHGELNERQGQLLQVLHSLTDKLGEASLKSLVSETVGVVERHYIEAALAMTSGNRSAAAKVLGLSRQSLYMKLARYQIGED